MKFKIKRSNGEKSWFDTFEIKPGPHMSVLEALFQIQDEKDSSLAFRYSCRGAVCGSCAMLINKKQRLACRTQVSEILGERVLTISPYGPVAKPEIKMGEDILIEPLPNLPVIKDLIVDMKPFFKHYEEVVPGFDVMDQSLMETPMSPMSQNDVKKVDKYAACILCGLCYGACPAAARDSDYLGPAALANAWRFYADTRYHSKDEMLNRVNSRNGVWACNEVYRCVEVCPKNVQPTNAITGFMRKIIVYKMKHLLR
ncbi:MAG: succinate dehydrogenase/fumarate reductase iron-sulfur subunit [Candidatus Methanoperedens sp.]|nr:succinate dehydrogenase/fumarate reductase iron-sulfur subunit [Candidatus Methanoperedens sp.]